MQSLESLLEKMVQVEASDLHLKVGSPPVFRLNGDLQMFDQEHLGPEVTKDYAASLMSDRQIRQFSEISEVDFAYSAPEVGRFRVNVYRQRGSISRAVDRRLRGTDPPPERCMQSLPR